MALRNGDDTLNESLDILESLSRMAVTESAALAAECRITGQTGAQAAADAAMQQLLVRASFLACAQLSCPACS